MDSPSLPLPSAWMRVVEASVVLTLKKLSGFTWEDHGSEGRQRHIARNTFPQPGLDADSQILKSLAVLESGALDHPGVEQGMKLDGRYAKPQHDLPEAIQIDRSDRRELGAGFQLYHAVVQNVGPAPDSRPIRGDAWLTVRDVQRNAEGRQQHQQT